MYKEEIIVSLSYDAQIRHDYDRDSHKHDRDTSFTHKKVKYRMLYDIYDMLLIVKYLCVIIPEGY